MADIDVRDVMAELRRLAKKATDGPWREYPIGSEGSLIHAGGNTIRTHRRIGNTYEFDDATFAVAAVNFVHELISSEAGLVVVPAEDLRHVLDWLGELAPMAPRWNASMTANAVRAARLHAALPATRKD